ncbi:MAG: ComEA family DNA-binding protein [Chloroflexi bacterium]|nr:ComEA family DNA-binding protein [Chloroflexota bacterium]
MDRYRQFLLGLLTGLAAAGLLLVTTRQPVGKPIELRPPPTPVGVRIHVVGAVASAGVYALPPGSIVQDALQAAGGPLPEADLTEINLAGGLSDGQQLALPTRPPTPRPAAPAGGGTLAPTPTGIPARTAVPSPAPGSGLVNINTASQAELESLPGIGPSLAGRIIEYRTANGPFPDVDALTNVNGIGPATLEKLRPYITVDSGE